MYDISVVILNYKMRTLVEACLTSLYEDMATSELSVAVVVVDNDSQDGLLEWIAEKFPTARTIQTGKNQGFGKSVNIGLDAEIARYYFILNPDTRFTEKNTLRRLHDYMEARPQIGMCAPQLLYGDGSIQYTCNRFPDFFIQLIRRSPLSHYSYFAKKIDWFLMKDMDRTCDQPVDWVQGSAMFARREALARVGNFDGRFWMYFEDTDLCRRFWKAGWPIYYVPSISLIHYHGRGSAKVPGMFRPLFKNKLAREHLKSWANYFWKWRRETFFSHL